MTMHLDRRTYIGGSAVAAILGLAPKSWKGRNTPLAMYEFMTSPRQEEILTEEKRKFFARRKRQEPVIAEMLADEYGIEVTRLSLDDNPNRYIDKDVPYFAAEIDFEFPLTDRVKRHFEDREDVQMIDNGTIVNGEIKTVHPFSASQWGEQGSEEVPVYYAAQVMHGLGVTNRPLGLCAALFGLDGLVCFPILSDAETILSMRAELQAFWQRVQDRNPPPPTTMEELVTKLTNQRGLPTELSDEAAKALFYTFETNRQIKNLKESVDDARLLLFQFISDVWDKELDVRKGSDGELKIDMPTLKEDVTLTYQGNVVASWNKQSGSYLNQTLLRAKLGDVLADRLSAHVDAYGAMSASPDVVVSAARGMFPGLLDEFNTKHWFRVLRAKSKR